MFCIWSEAMPLISDASSSHLVVFMKFLRLQTLYESGIPLDVNCNLTRTYSHQVVIQVLPVATESLNII